MLRPPPVLIVGAGIGGLAAALRLAAAGVPVRVLEKGPPAGGKIRPGVRPDLCMDTGPTVGTLRPVFEQLFASAGQELADVLTLDAVDVIAHHRWPDGSHLDLHADPDRRRAAIRDFAGPRGVRDVDRFAARAAAVYARLDERFLRRPQRGLVGLLARTPLTEWHRLAALQPFRSLWAALGRDFADPRLRQLFARYATYCGSSPFAAPATLRLIAHVELAGVFRIRGGMRALARALRDAAERAGAEFSFGCHVTEILTDSSGLRGLRCRDGAFVAARSVIVNADTQALASGALGDDVRRAVPALPRAARSLSAVTFAGKLPDLALPTLHNVLFSRDYRAEFQALDRERRVPPEPTVYVASFDAGATGPKRALLIANAPADGDSRHYTDALRATIRERVEAGLADCGVALRLDGFECTTPNEFADRYPATGGALYGPAMHGWRAAFRRPGNATRIPGLFVAGGSVHPGSGVPMAALSGSMAADAVLAATGANRVPRAFTAAEPRHAR